MGFLPQVGAIEIEPQIVLEMVLPPLLFSAAVRMPTMDFRREMQAVAMLAIPLVFLSAFAVGFVINWLVPAISLPWGVALGAVLSPTDAVAISIAKRSGVSHRIITVLEGEGLFNDATSLVLLSAAMSAGLAADEHALNPGLLIGKVAIALGIAAGIGWVVGEVGVRLRALIKEPSADTVFSFAMPFIASIPAEHLGGSGLVAAVVAGLVVSRRRAATISAANRRFSQQNWQTMTLVLESGIFLTMGLQAFGIVEETAAFSGGLAFAAFLAVTLGALIMVIRAVFIALMFTWLDHRHKRRQRRYEAEAARIERFEKRMHKASEVDADMLQARDLSPERWEDALNHYRRRRRSSGARAATRCADPTWTTSRANRWARARAVSSSGRARRNAMRGSDLDYFESEPLGPREGSVIVWAGMRGAITLAAAQTISTHAPMRAFLLTIALFIAAGALVIQGLTLPGLIRIVKPKMATGDISEEERAKLLKVMGSALVDTALAQAIH
nr:sodium:proton antiporter [Rothia mucilaginosa]